jgi:XkdW protein
MVKNLYDALNVLFPGASEDDWKLQDDGEGPYIKSWNRQEPIPSQLELDAAEALFLSSLPKKQAALEIQALEARFILPRVVREYMLVDFRDKTTKAGLDPMTLPAYVKLKALDDQISALRRKL